MLVSGEKRGHPLWLGADPGLQLPRETISVDGSGGARGPLSTAQQGETPLCCTTVHRHGLVGALKGWASCPGTDDMSATSSPKTGMTLGTLSSSASQPAAPTHVSGVPARREGRKVELGVERSQA